jgi:hypothetical protein
MSTPPADINMPDLQTALALVKEPRWMGPSLDFRVQLLHLRPSTCRGTEQAS